MCTDLSVIAMNNTDSQPLPIPALILVTAIEIPPPLRHLFPQLTNLPCLVDIPAYLCTIKEERSVDVIAPTFPLLHCADIAGLIFENRITLTLGDEPVHIIKHLLNTLPGLRHPAVIQIDPDYDSASVMIQHRVRVFSDPTFLIPCLVTTVTPLAPIPLFPSQLTNPHDQ
jgi:hypothetical protein